MKELIQAVDSKVEIVFFLDAYDELSSEFQGKNLWVTNDLYQYHAKQPVEEHSKEEMPEGLVSVPKPAQKAGNSSLELGLDSKPKVIITVRSELLSGDEDYQSWFLPLEHVNKHKDEPEEAILCESNHYTLYTTLDHLSTTVTFLNY